MAVLGKQSYCAPNGQEVIARLYIEGFHYLVFRSARRRCGAGIVGMNIITSRAGISRAGAGIIFCFCTGIILISIAIGADIGWPGASHACGFYTGRPFNV